uniref:MFS transporter n=1 Tax=Nocardia cyriacigeorgica TaxID=135487 RepID=UPI0024550FCC
GLGTMLTMPLAGALADKLTVGRIVPVGMLTITVAMFGLSQTDAHTSYPVLLGLLFVLGLGMGGPMMPLMTAALRTLTEHEVARVLNRKPVTAPGPTGAAQVVD